MQKIFALITSVTLASSASLKLLNFAESDSASVDVFDSAQFKMCLILAELYLAAKLAFQPRDKMSWMLTQALFACFILYSTYTNLSGSTDCGCFGAIKINPVATMLTDSFFLAALLALSPHKQTSDQPFSSNLRQRRVTLALSAVCILLTAASSAMLRNFVGPEEMSAWLRINSQFLQKNGTVDFGLVQSGSAQVRKIKIPIGDKRPIKLLGAKNACGTFVNADLPIMVEPQDYDLEIAMLLESPMPYYNSTIRVWYSDAESRLRWFDIRIVANVV